MQCRLHCLNLNLNNIYVLRRESGKCCICYDPVSTGTAASAASYGLTAGPTADAIKAAVGTQCTGVTTVAAAGVGLGDYVEIPALHAVRKSNNYFFLY